MTAEFLPALEGVFSWLLEASWQASVLVAFVLILQTAFRRWLNPRWRHALWLLVILRLALPFMPESTLSLFQFTPRPPPALTQSVTEPIFSPAEIQASPSAPVNISTPRHPFSLFTILALAWLTGALSFLGVTWMVNHRFAVHVKKSPPINDPHLLNLAAAASAEFHFRRPLRMIESTQVRSPAVVGLFHPTLILPESVRSRFSDVELRFIFLHELAHLKRGDLVAQSIVAILQILHWFNPVLWFAFRRMRADREPATDALVLSRTGEAQREPYGQVLIKLLEHYHQRHSLPTLVGILEDKDQFKRRFLLIRKFTRGAYGWSFLGVLLVTILAVAGLTAEKQTGPELIYKVNGTAISLSRESQERIEQELKGIVESLNFTSDEHPDWFPILARKSPQQIKSAGSYLYLRYPDEKSFVTYARSGIVKAQEIYLGFEDSVDPTAGSYPGEPGGLCLVNTQGHIIYFSKESGMLLIKLGLDPDIYPHLAPGLKKTLAMAKESREAAAKSTADLDSIPILDFQVSGEKFQLSQGAREEISQLVNEMLIMRYINGVPDEAFDFQTVPDTTLQDLQEGGSFLHLTWAKEEVFPVGAHDSFKTKEVWIGLKDSVGSYPGYPGGIMVETTDGKPPFNLMFGSKSLLVGIGQNPEIYPHLSREMKRTVDESLGDFQAYKNGQPKKIPPGIPSTSRRLLRCKRAMS